jgi:group II intron reverse transcriptase/maturase/CRISPR-associated endonuclease Cas1
MNLPLESLLPLHGVIVTLRFRQASRFGFFHQPALSAFIRYLAGSPEHFDRLVRVDACESGRLHYPAGSCYRFTLFVLNGGYPLLLNLLEALRQLPASASGNDRNMPLRRNCELISLYDVFAERLLDGVDTPSPYTLTALRQECRIWENTRSFHVLFLSPVRLLKEKNQRTQLKGEARFCRQRQDLSPALLHDRLYDHFASLIAKNGDTPAQSRPVPQQISLSEESHLFWLDVHYTDADSKAHPMGGMTGLLIAEVAQPECFSWELWVLGQYTGFGQRCAFGWGRYQLQTVSRAFSFRRAFPAASLLAEVKARENLILAIAHINENIQRTKLPTADQEEADEGLLERLEADIEQMFSGRFAAPTLNGMVLDKPDGSLRPLAVPPFRDRVLQRAVVQVLHPIAEAVQSPQSFGYRPGRSRITARYVIQAAWREGYRWVYESDIEDFFDTVSWGRLEVKLRALWGDHEPLLAGILAWLKAPVAYSGQILQRRNGLPQGSPLSPLLANLMLDDFDADMQAAGFKLVRFADDFVVLCKSRQQAEAAHSAALQALADHQLRLNAEKTRIGEMADGFHYLGYLFVNDMVLESPKGADQNVPVKSISEHAWLAKFAARPAKPLLAPEIKSLPKPAIRETKLRQPVDDEVEEQCEFELDDEFAINDSSDQFDENTGSLAVNPAAKSTPALALGERIDHGLLLCVSGESAHISSHLERIDVQRQDKTVFQAPWRHLQCLLLLGRHHITSPALATAMEFNVPIHFASSTGKYQGVVWNGQAASQGCQLWLKQQSAFTDPDQALLLSREIVSVRLLHIRETLRLRQQSAPATQIEAIQHKVALALSLQELNGLEGSATRLYFLALREIIPAEFGFDGRNRQPPLDPFNALLSMGYTLLYSCLESILRCDGLLPWQGFYHQGHGRHATLASDLMEPFRHIVERQALAMLKRHELKLTDFYWTDQQACYLKKPARNLYLGKLVAKFDSKLSSKYSTEARSLFTQIHQQNLSLIRYIESGTAFSAWRIR